jgi:pimeloyl-ACP methyl ester carboxylesterase
MPRTVQRALHALSRSRFLARAGDRFLIGVLKQVRRYLTEPSTRERVQSEIASVVDADTRVIVGHSLGSVVAYEALCAHPKWPVRVLVTLGSPLGIPNVVFERLRPAPEGGRGRWPGSVRQWTNVCDAYDVVALVKRLAPLFGDGAPTRTVRDITINNGWRAHAIEHHLSARETGAAIAAGLAREPE